MTNYDTDEARNIDEVEDRIIAFSEAMRTGETPFGARKAAELDIQFSADPSFGLTKERYGWYSNDTLFDSTFFTENGGTIDIETSATSGDSARIRSAYAGQYISHTVAEPGLGLIIPSKHLEYDSNERVSLTHGEISAELVEWDDSTGSGINAIGLSFEPDATYVQVRRGDSNVDFVPQKDWNIDSLDGTGPSGVNFRPEDGYVYIFEYSWYGQGSITFKILNANKGEMIPFHRTNIKGNPPTSTPNMPIQLTIENKTTADPLGARLGGLQFATHGSGNLEGDETGRTTEETRHTASSYIDTNVTLVNDAIDPFEEPGRPLISARRDLSNLESRTSLSLEVIDFFINSGGDVYIFIFDEFDDANALTNASFGPPISRDATNESRIETDTSATDYTPQSAALRGMLYVSGDKNAAEVITGDSSAKVPLESTTVVTAALPPGNNSTYAQPALLSLREGF